MSVKAQAVSTFTGHVRSMQLAIGPITRLWTHSLYRLILLAYYYGEYVHLGAEACRELVVWREHFKRLSFPIWPIAAREDVVSISDASNVAWAGGF